MYCTFFTIDHLYRMQWTRPLLNIGTSVWYLTAPGADPGILKNGVRGPEAVEFLGSWDCFDATLHIPYIFIVRVENKIHIVNISCWLWLKYMRVKQSKFTKSKPFFQTGRGERWTGPGSTFEHNVQVRKVV